MARKKPTQVDSDDSPSDSDGSDYVPPSQNPTPATRKRGRTPAAAKNQKKQRVQASSDDDASPQLSASRNGVDSDRENEVSDESGSESADSDCPNEIRESSNKRKKIHSSKGGKPSKQQKKPQSANTTTKRNTARKSTNSPVKKNVSRLSNSNGVSFDPKLVEPLAQKCVYFLLIEDQKKYAIKRKAIHMHVFKDEDYSPKLYLAVINKANKILQKTYGMELIELENQKDSYIIINILRRELGIHDFTEVSRLKQQQNGLILYLLTVIYMNDNVITEDELTKSLKALDIDLTSKRLHPVFGDVKKYITTELVKQLYLNYECVSKDPPKYEFTWGLRAKQEFLKKDLLQFACQVMDDTLPTDWKSQYKDAEVIVDA